MKVMPLARSSLVTSARQSKSTSSTFKVKSQIRLERSFCKPTSRATESSVAGFRTLRLDRSAASGMTTSHLP